MTLLRDRPDAHTLMIVGARLPNVGEGFGGEGNSKECLSSAKPALG